jgi:dynein heavy chain
MQVVMPVVTNDGNQSSWPKVVSRDLIRHMATLKGDVFSFAGQVKGKTLLPLPHQADLVVKAVESEYRYTAWDKLNNNNYSGKLKACGLVVTDS